MDKIKVVLVTGTHGFLGRNTAKFFQTLDYKVIGIGLGKWDEGYHEAYGIDRWIEAAVTLDNLLNLDVSPDIIIHCAGSGSVGYSFANPMNDFQMTVDSTVSILEYMKITGFAGKMIYPSSASVYGIKENFPIKETDTLDPISPYGYHKKIAKDLCKSYVVNYNLSVSIIRFFSIYGQELRKQLLWDACKKFSSAGGRVQFYGTGSEIRDWIHVDDAVKLIYQATQSNTGYEIINGASGEGIETKKILYLLSSNFNVEHQIEFNGIVREGDPPCYIADISRAKALGWKPEIPIQVGIANYVIWFKNQL